MNSQIINRYLVLIEGYSQQLAQHCLNSTGIALVISDCLNISEKEKIKVVTAAILHDLGKIKINSDILNKPGPLNSQEWKEIKKHPSYGLEIIAGEKALSPVKDLMLYHHERWDGEGYYGLCGRDIPLGARIIAFADAIEAMSTVRPYREAKKLDNIIAEIKGNRGTQFDPGLVNKVLSQVKEFAPILFYLGDIKQAIRREKLRLMDLVNRYHSLDHPLVWAQSRRLDKLVVSSFRSQNLKQVNL